MGRRLIVLIALALLVGLGVQLAPAHQQEPPAPDQATPPQPKPPAVVAPAVPDASGSGASLQPGQDQGHAGTKADPGPGSLPGPASSPPGGEPPPIPPTPPLPAPPAVLIPDDPRTPPPPGTPDPPRRDRRIERVQAPGPASAASGSGLDKDPLPPAGDGPGPPASGAAADSARDDEWFVLKGERLPLGRQDLGLTVDVQAPRVLNRNQEAELKIVVKNTGTTDALRVAVRDVLPDGLKFLGSQPEAQRADPLLVWKFDVVAAGAERVITVRVKPTRVGAFDHAATVSMMAGSKSRTIVREPRLKIEQTVSTVTVLKGRPVEFKITVSNPGDGPARRVIIQAKLSPGLRHESGEPNEQNLFEQTIERIDPAQRIVLDPLIAEAIQGGPQTCRVVAHSPDVSPGSDEGMNEQAISVVEPLMKVSIAGDEKRLTDTIATYILTVENPGTAPASKVRVQATVPVDGKLTEVPAKARWDSIGHRIQWDVPQLEPRGKLTLSFKVRMGGIGLYQVTAVAKADGTPLAKATFSTDVTGVADVDFDVQVHRRIVDVGQTNVYQIKIKNIGSKEATNLQIRAKLSDNLKVEETAGTEKEAGFNKETGEVVFPPIERLERGKETVLAIKVTAVKPGQATCRAFLKHDDLESALDDVAATRIMVSRRPPGP
jgi:uncharacterized repeat protein (TIGR01451 family)